jgi:tetratricopeptide (TPR) repeat protein
MVYRVLASPNCPVDFASIVFQDRGNKEILCREVFIGFVVISRILDQNFDNNAENIISVFVGKIIEIDPNKIPLILFQIILLLGRKSVYTPLCNILTNVMKKQGSLDVAKILCDAIPIPSSLINLLIWSIDKQIEHLDENDDEYILNKVVLLHKKSACLGNELDEWSEAFAIAKESLNLIALLKEKDTDFYRAFYPNILVNFSMCAEFVGKLDDSLYANLRVVAYRKRKKTKSSIDQFLYAQSLMNLGCIYHARRESEKSYKYTKDALEILKSLYESLPCDIDTYRLRLNYGDCYKNLSCYFFDEKKYDEALNYSLRGEEIFSRLASEIPFGFSQKWADSIRQISKCFMAMDNYDEAIKRNLQSISIYKSLGVNSIPVLDSLAESHALHGVLLYSTKKHEDAKLYFEQGMYTMSQRCFDEPNQNFSRFRQCIYNYLICCFELNKNEIEGFVKHDLILFLKKLFDRTQNKSKEIIIDFCIEMAVLLTEEKPVVNAGLHLFDLSVRFSRQLLDNDNENTSLRLAIILLNQGTVFVRLGYFENALLVLKESCEKLDLLVQNGHCELLFDYGKCNFNIGTSLSKKERYTEAITYTLKSNEVFSSIQQDDKTIYLRFISCCYLSHYYSKLGLLDESVLFKNEARSLEPMIQGKDFSDLKLFVVL